MSGTFASDSLQCILQLALQGAGIAKLADFLVADRIRTGELVRVLADGVEGWGECVAGTEPTYSSEYTAGAHAVAVEHLVPRLLAADVRHGADVEPALAGIRGHRMAKAAIEAAVLDAELRSARTSLADHLGATADRVAVGVSIGILPTVAIAFSVTEDAVTVHRILYLGQNWSA